MNHKGTKVGKRADRMGPCRAATRPLVGALALVALALTGCLRLGNLDYRFSLRTDELRPADIRQAEIYRRTLPVRLKLPPERVRIEPGPGVTDIIVSGVNSEPARQAIIADVASFNAHHAFSSVQLTFR